MQYVQLPRTELRVSRLAFGCWGITNDMQWSGRSEAGSLATIHEALAAGINFFDTAAMYAEGESERLLGRALRDRPREAVVVASKMKPADMRPEEVVAACEATLARLGLDYLDLYQTHWTDRSLGLTATWEGMLRLRDAGKVRYLGVCNAGVEDLREVAAMEPPTTNQVPYNLLWRAIEEEILPECRAREIGVLAYSPLQHGLLTGRFATADDVPEGRARSRHFSTERPLARHGEPGFEGETFTTIAALSRVAAGLGRELSEVALAWLFAQPGVCCVIAGASSPAQLAANTASLADPLPAEAVAELNAASEALRQALGANPDMWQGTAGSRYR